MGCVLLSDLGDKSFNGMNCITAWSIYNGDRAIPVRGTNIKGTKRQHTTKSIIIRPIEKGWDTRDQDYFRPLYISSQQLEEDKIKPINGFYVCARNYSVQYKCNNIAYAMTDFPDGRVKIYQPLEQDPTKKWKSTTTHHDIGFYDRVIGSNNEVLIVCKGYMDARITCNLTRGIDIVWIQAEGNNIHDKILALPHKHKLLFMDNDIAGTGYLCKHLDYMSERGHHAIPMQLPVSLAKDTKESMQRHGYKYTHYIINKLIDKCLSPSYSIPFSR